MSNPYPVISPKKLIEVALPLDAINAAAAREKSYAALAAKTEAARQLAYRLYTLCERKNWAEEARAYNDLVAGWGGIELAALHVKGPVQKTLFNE